jgi:hypothetical protein
MRFYIFNKNLSGFSQLLDKVPLGFQQHKELYRDLGEQAQGEWRYVLTTDVDESRRILVHLLLFNLYVKEKS